MAEARSRAAELLKRRGQAAPADDDAGQPDTALGAAAATASYGRGARVLSIGIASAGLLTFAYFAIASHVLGAVAAKQIDLVWSVMFVIISVIYRPIEQLLSRSIADRRARGFSGMPLRVPITIQLGFALAFLAVALALRPRIQDHVFDGSATLYWVFVVGVLAYAGSYFARGWLAGHKYFGLYGGLVLMESLSRVAFAVAVAIGIASGQSAVALGMVAAPIVSLVVVPAAFMRHGATASAARGSGPAASGPALHPNVADADAALEGPAAESVEEAVASWQPDKGEPLSLRSGAGFAGAVSGIQLAEQVLLNAGVLTVAATSANPALAGIAFNVLLIARAPLVLFQSIQTSLLPHLAGLEATAGRAAFARAIRVTVLAIAAFTALVALGLLAIGPFVMRHVFGQHFDYGRVGLALIGLGMGLHLVSGALNQAALAREQARAAAILWLGAAALFLAWAVSPIVGDELLRIEIGYPAATGLLALGLLMLYRAGDRRPRRAADGDPAASA